MRKRKVYRKNRDKATGEVRSLAPAEIVKHRDSANDNLSNLLVLPIQRSPTHIEDHLRCARKGMPSLSPERFRDVTQDRRNMLFESVTPQ